GIRDWSVTGVQTCALPIFLRKERQAHKSLPQVLKGHVLGRRARAVRKQVEIGVRAGRRAVAQSLPLLAKEIDELVVSHGAKVVRSEERRVGKEARSRRA